MLPIAAYDRQQRFFRHIRATYGLSTEALVEVVRNRAYTPAFRAGALRNLVGAADLSITKGACFGLRRRFVRAHFQV